MNASKPNVQWPGKAYDEDGDDLGAPLQQLLIDLHVLEKEGDVGAVTWTQTPPSVQVITAGATTLGKYWPAVIAFFGGGGAIATGIKGWGLGTGNSVTERAVLTASAAGLAAAVAIAVAIMVRADVGSRALASAAQYQARASVASALLTSGHYNVPLPPDPAPPVAHYMLQTGGRWYPVREFASSDSGVVAYLVDNPAPVPLSQVSGLVTNDAWATPE